MQSLRLSRPIYNSLTPISTSVTGQYPASNAHRIEYSGAFCISEKKRKSKRLKQRADGGTACSEAGERLAKAASPDTSHNSGNTIKNNNYFFNEFHTCSWACLVTLCRKLYRTCIAGMVSIRRLCSGDSFTAGCYKESFPVKLNSYDYHLFCSSVAINPVNSN